MVDWIVSAAVEKLKTILEDKVAMLVDISDEIEKLSSKFISIQALLEDAESRRVKDRSVKIWLEKVKDVAYDVEDILDEWMTEARKSKVADEGDGSSPSKKRKVSSILSAPFTKYIIPLKLRLEIGSRIKEVRRRLDDIEKDKSQLCLRVYGAERECVDSEVRRAEIGERETGSLVNRSSIIGREREKDEVVHLLLQEVTEVPFVISIVGMGGLGKTTLAQLTYNDEIVKGHFDKRMWVCVSEDFNVKRITKSIIESASGSRCDDLNLDLLQSRLHEMLHAKRFLLVLDDIWSEDREKWDKLRLPFQAGALGSRIVITTRSEKVALAMGNSHMCKLAALSEDECWLLFSRGAFELGNAEERSELEEIGRQIVNKCGGLPLAAKTIGSAMCSRKTRRQWELVLESEIWNSADILGDILPALLLSYHDLPAALKQCFAYCSIFPKDWLIEKDTIVKLWVAQGFICSKGSQDMEEIGELYFEDLLRRSLLQDAKLDDDDDQKIVSCKMHDLVHDLAQSVAGSECSVVDNRKQALELSEADAMLKLNNVRHSTVTVSVEADAVAFMSDTLYKASKLRTLLLDTGISVVPQILFNHWRCLRALKLSGTRIEKLSPTVGQLKHLRFLDLSWTNVEELPEEVCNCLNLQTLRLDGCQTLKKLPGGMKKMINLRFLDLSGTDVEELPEEVCNCLNLQTLRLNWCQKLKKLPGGMKKMINLRFLYLSGTGVEELPEEVCNSLNLQTLRLNWCGKLKKLPGGMKKMINLRHLEFEGYRTLEYLPQGIGKLTSLRTVSKFIVGGGDEGCKCGELKHLNRLQGSLEITGLDKNRSRDEAREAELNKKQHLHTLSFEYKDECDEPVDEDQVKRMEDVLEFLQPHTNLKELAIRYYRGSKLPKWIEDPVFSNLVKVNLWYCRECKLLPCLGKLPSLKYLNISYMKEVRKVGVEFSGVDNNDGSGCVVSFPKLETLIFLSLQNWEEWELRGGVGEVMPSLHQLEVTWCPKLKELPSNLPPVLQKLTLHISNEGMLSSGGTLPVLPNLKHLIIYGCNELTSFPCGWLGQFKALETLGIKGCGKLKELPSNLPPLLHKLTLQISNEGMLSSGGTLPVLPNLKHLKIPCSPGLKSFPCGWLEQFKALITLEIHYCWNLESLPDEELQQLTMLQELKIEGCRLLRRRYGDGGEDRDKIAQIPNISFCL